AVGGLVPYTTFAAANWPDPFFLLMFTVSVIIAVLVVAFWSILSTTQHLYDELLFKEYYMKRHEDQRINS
ncbi:hypothetical protein, partial [Halorubrum sp. SP3]